MAGKSACKVQLQSELDEMTAEGILAVQAGHNAYVIEARLKMYFP